MQRIMVDLPDPDGPRDHDTLAACHLEVDIAQHLRVAIPLADAPQFDHRRRGIRCGVLRHRPLQGGRAAIQPPSTRRFSPVMKVASSDARNSAALATSSGVPRRGIGVRGTGVIHPARLRGAAGLAGDDLAGRNRVTDDGIPGVVGRDLAGDVDHASLRGAVGDIFRAGDHAVLRRDVNDAAARAVTDILVQHLRHRRPRHQEHAGEIDRKGIPFRQRGFDQRLAGADRGVIDQTIDTAELAHREIDGALRIGLGGDIDPDELDLVALGLQQVGRRNAAFPHVGRDIGRDQPGAFLAKRHAIARPMPDDAPGDQDGFAEQTFHRAPLHVLVRHPRQIIGAAISSE